MAVTTLRNLVVLLARTGADTDALTLYMAWERVAPRRGYGPRPTVYTSPCVRCESGTPPMSGGKPNETGCRSRMSSSHRVRADEHPPGDTVLTVWR
jgi:hypothetical protein